MAAAAKTDAFSYNCERALFQARGSLPNYQLEIGRQ
jgi:hypothetical protein